MKSQYYVPLFDTENGGPADAFKCLICSQDRDPIGLKRKKTITYTEGGMLSHLFQYHGIEVGTVNLWQNKEDSQQPHQAKQPVIQKNERSIQNGGEHNQE